MKKLSLLLFFATPLWLGEPSKAFSFFTSSKSNKHDKIEEKVASKVAPKKGAVKKYSLLRPVSIAIGIAIGVGLTQTYHTYQNQKVITPSQETPEEKVEKYKQFLTTNPQAPSSLWGEKLTQEKSLMDKVTAYVTSQNKTSTSTSWREWICQKHGTIVGDIADILRLEGIDIRAANPNGYLVISGLTEEQLNVDMTPLHRAFIFAQLIHLLQAVVGNSEAKNILNSDHNKLLAQLVEQHNNSEQAVDKAQEHGASDMNCIPDIFVLLRMAGSNPADKPHFGNALFKDGTQIILGAAKSKEEMKKNLYFNKTDGEWDVYQKTEDDV